MKLLAMTVAVSIAICLPAQGGQVKPAQPADPGRSEWLATGGQAWDRVAAVVLEGTMTEGGVPGKFEKTIDQRTGHSRTVQETGAMRALSGFDGVAWTSNNGIVNSIDLPSLVADARSQAFVDRAGWRAKTAQTSSKFDPDGRVVHYVPPGGSEIEVSFDQKSHVVRQIVAHTDLGLLTTTYDDWRSVGKVKFAFRQVQKDNRGGVTTFEVHRVRLLGAIPAGALARPERSPHSHLGSSDARVPFTYVGSGSHILLAAKVNEMDAKVIFDTGAANYFAPASARRFGLEVSGGLNLGGVGESSTTGGFAEVNKISIGSAELKDEAVMVGPTPFGAQADVPDGFVGFEFLSEFRTILDYPAKTITFTQFGGPRPVAGVTVPFFSDGHSIYVQAEVDSQPGMFRLDTGDGGTVTLFPTFATLHNLYQNSGEIVASGGGVGGKVSVRRVTVSRFMLAGAEFTGVPGELSQNTAGGFASRSIAGNLGGGILRCFRITFDYVARTLTFESGAEHLRDCAASHHD